MIRNDRNIRRSIAPISVSIYRITLFCLHSKSTMRYWKPCFSQFLTFVVHSIKSAKQLSLRLDYSGVFRLRSTALKLFNPASRFSMISSANTSGSGRLSRSVRLLSFNQNTSKLALSRAISSS